ncbi:uncharacterized protein CYBJADRAFT_161517 [Cyberlindnera jadinii NRRL Y-1542]|uniref:DUF1751-domain-containing protein n=1 Tax=Cyberlindnera jadinii (strain ATCC 18201 / CBS 1600 / BCRC 20928 / JCM 3617 / NBRC 0987 / NRRL Y-1542) TaxID=983966 RepID=A0A1E4S6M4_CYBJN|nr:DUF1751-domain-containing protein [Cyberlindnera jadinii NRRL Y-1542]ODV75042.1 DUF1751-domain-containing protein [Cyberlindnera jadinii NRRL Y-1542]
MSSSLTSKLNFSSLNVPPATRALLITLTLGTVLLQFLKNNMYKALVSSGETDINMDYIIVPFLQLVPNHTLWHPWTVITALFVDTSVSRYLVSLFFMFFAGKFIERSWSSKELVRFVLIVGGAANLLTSIALIFSNLIFGNEFFNIPVDGNLCLLVSYLVVLKQLIPEHSVVLFKGVLQFRVKHIPFFVLIVVTVISSVTASSSPALQAWIGLIASWTYLRFFQSSVADPLLPQHNNVVGVRRIYGDASETFSFVHFFPDVFAPILGPIFNQFYETLVQLNILPRFNETDIEQGNIIASRRLTGHASHEPDTRNAAERRRQVALKVLEERIGEDATRRETTPVSLWSI